VPLGLGDKGDARPLADWRSAFAAVSEELAPQIRHSCRTAETARHRSRTRTLQAAQQAIRRASRRSYRIEADVGATAVLRVTYSLAGARWCRSTMHGLTPEPRIASPHWTSCGARRSCSKRRRLNDVALSVSTVRTAKGGNAPTANIGCAISAISVVDFVSAGVRRAPSGPLPPEDWTTNAHGRIDELAKARESEASADTGGFQVVYRIGGRVSIAQAKVQRVSHRIASMTPDLMIRATPSLDITAFLRQALNRMTTRRASGRVSLYRDGIFVGRGVMALTPKEEPYGSDLAPTIKSRSQKYSSPQRRTSESSVHRNR